MRALTGLLMVAGVALGQRVDCEKQVVDANLQYEHGDYKKAESSYRLALSAAEHNSDCRAVHPVILRNLGSVLIVQARYSEAEDQLRRALKATTELLGEEHPQTATVLGKLARLYEERNELHKAEQFYERALRISPDSDAILNGLASVYTDESKLDQAERLAGRALAIREREWGPDHPKLSLILNTLAVIHYEQGRYVEAEELYRRILTISGKTLDGENPDVAAVLSNLAKVYYKEARFSEAETLYQRALQIIATSLGAEHPLYVATLENYASLLRASKRKASASRLENQARRIREKRAAQKPSAALRDELTRHESMLGGRINVLPLSTFEAPWSGNTA
jgi:tetratricopeptide (TPR) repeat protein